MKILFSISLLFLAANLFAVAPLESGYSLAPKPSASPEEKQRAYLEARNRVISAAMKYENTPYKYGGMTSAGLDCSGFICLSFKDALGVNLPRSASALFSWVEKIPLEKAQPGDLLFFKTDGTGRVTHVGLYLGNRRFIHAASVGAKTGVIINTLDEGSWTRNYAGAGRVFPEAASGFVPENASHTANVKNNSEGWGGLQGSRVPGTNPGTSPGTSPSKNNAASGDARLLLGAAFAPSWKVSSADGELVSGFTSQLRLGADTNTFGRRMIFGLEVRPEYNGTRKVFRLPITFSWGFDDRLRFFAGPVYDSGEKDWFGTVGVTFAPYIINTSGGEFAPYAEVAWQSTNNDIFSNDNFSDGFRFSTGIRWSINAKNYF